MTGPFHITRALEKLVAPILDPQYRVPDCDDLTEVLDLGVELCRQGNWRAGMDLLGRLAEPEHRQRPYAGLYFSYLGYGIAAHECRVEEGLRLCRFAVSRRDDHHPETHLNLGRALLLAGRRYAASRALRRGLAIDPLHAELRELLRALGQRRRPVVPFLPRHSAVNRVLGRLRHRLLDHRAI